MRATVPCKKKLLLKAKMFSGQSDIDYFAEYLRNLKIGTFIY